MANIIQLLQELKKTQEKEIDKIIASLSTHAATAAVVEDAEEIKLTPIQKLEKQKETANEKLAKLDAKIAEGKSKTKDKDQENKTKFEEIISNIDAKIAEIQSKEAAPAKAAAKKAAPAKAAAKKIVTKVTEDVPLLETAEVKVPETKKHVPRITPAITVNLKEAFKTVDVKWDDKYKSDFTKWVNSLSNEDYGKKNLEGHISAFANAQLPPALGGSTVVKPLRASDLKGQAINLDEVSVGVYRHKTTGEMVTGPDEDSEEEFEEVTLKEVDYVVGQTTKRVYKVSDGPDEFVGYWGVGEFYDHDL